MKKLYTLLMAAVLGSMAANAELSWSVGSKAGEKPVTSGSTIACSDYEDDGENYIFDPHLWLQSTSAMKNCQITIKSEKPVQFCGTGSCVFVTERTFENVVLGPNAPVNMMLEYPQPMDDGLDFTPFTCEIEAKNPLSESTARTIKIVFGKDATGIYEVNPAGNEISFAAGAFNYNVQGNAELKVFTLLGAQVLSTRISGNGSLSVSNLGKGAYIYQVSGAMKASGKFICR